MGFLNLIEQHIIVTVVVSFPFLKMGITTPHYITVQQVRMSHGVFMHWTLLSMHSRTAVEVKF